MAQDVYNFTNNIEQTNFLDQGVPMKMLRKLSTLAVLATTSTGAFASVTTDKKFDRLISNYKISPADQQTYCYTDGKGGIQGKRVDQQIRIASVTKLVTSLWATQKLGANHTYETKLFLRGDHLHIQGSFDPFMSNEKMIYLVSSLNKLGVTHLKKITYDKLVQINPSAQVHTDQYPLITRDSNGKWISLYFNTAKWTSTLKADYRKYANLAPSRRYVKNPSFSVDEVTFSEYNPFGLSVLKEMPKDIRVLTLKSPPLYKYLKEINVKSNNYASHTIFRDLGGEAAFRAYAMTLGFSTNDITLYNGNGLPTSINGTRYDNTSTCRTIAKLVETLKETAERQSRDLEDIVAVPGSDGGTFRSRLNSSDLKNTLVAKTGTLMHTSTLAGALNTRKGYSFFGIFNHTENVRNAKYLQNEMVRFIFDDMGGSKNFKYTVEGFLPYDKNSTVKSLEQEVDAEEETNFTELGSELTEM